MDNLSNEETTAFPYEDLYSKVEMKVPEADNINDWDKYVEAEVLLANEGVEKQAGKVIFNQLTLKIT